MWLSSVLIRFVYPRLMPVRKRSSEGMAEWVTAREHAGRQRRIRISMPVELELTPGSKIAAEINDLSKDGFRLRSSAVLHAGQALTMHLPRDTARCEVRWVDGLDAGGVFHEPARISEW
jgi:hypothetical protein